MTPRLSNQFILNGRAASRAQWLRPQYARMPLARLERDIEWLRVTVADRFARPQDRIIACVHLGVARAEMQRRAIERAWRLA